MRFVNIIFLFFFILLFIGCKKNDLVLERPDKKLNALRAQYTEQLAGAKNGWIGYLYPEGGKGFTFKFEFSKDNRVLTYAAMNEGASKRPLESSYRIAADQVLSLYFDTYSYLHVLADPDDMVNGGFRGAGLISDFEFAILEVQTDTIKLKGNHNGSEFILVRANDDQGKDYINKAFLLNSSLERLDNYPHYYKKINIANQDVQFSINSVSNTISFYYDSQGFKQYTTEYAVTDNGILLRQPFIFKDQVIRELFDFNLDPKNGIGNFMVNGNKKYEIINSSKPVVLDTDAPRRMYLNRYQYSSFFGFTINGVLDGINMRRLPYYQGMFFIPRRYMDPLDAVYFTFNAGAGYIGPLFNTTYSPDGKLHFKEFMPLTGINPGEQYHVVVYDFNKVWFEKSGFYVYQTGDNFYDMVSVADSKVWIRFN